MAASDEVRVIRRFVGTLGPADESRHVELLTLPVGGSNPYEEGVRFGRWLRDITCFSFQKGLENTLKEVER